MNLKIITLTSALPLIALSGCVTNPITDLTRAPAEVGGRFLLGGLELLKPKENYGFTGELSASEQALRERSKAFDRTVWQGVLIGAVAGTAIGAITGGDAEDAVGGAIIGASVGALAGIYVAKKQRQFSSQEDQLAAMTKDVRTANRQTEELIASIRTVIAEDQRRLADVQTRYQRGKATEEEVKQEQARVWSNRTVVEKATLGAKDQYQVFEGAKRKVEQTHPTAATQAFAREVKTYRQSIDALDKIAANMAKA
jgi:formiminotetrahydrofolate cyclodeaminase